MKKLTLRSKILIATSAIFLLFIGFLFAMCDLSLNKYTVIDDYSNLSGRIYGESTEGYIMSYNPEIFSVGDKAYTLLVSPKNSDDTYIKWDFKPWQTIDLNNDLPY